MGLDTLVKLGTFLSHETSVARGSYLIVFDSDQTLMLKKAFTQS